ncbi:MAG TPA: hypothetical protein VF546_04185 [Pyrinomonadaceae bacterium]|jgi:hypothetical protein
MQRRYRAVLLAALVGAVCLGGSARAQAKRQGAAQPCPDKVATTGKYSNTYFGFSMVIPKERQGVWNSGRCDPDEKVGCVCLGPDHGRAIPLGEGAGIEVFAGFGREPRFTLADYEREELAIIQERPGVETVEVLSTGEARLGKLAALRYVVRVGAQGKQLIEEHIIAVDKGVEYTLVLSSPAGRYEQDKREFEQVVKSWRLIKRTR